MQRKKHALNNFKAQLLFENADPYKSHFFRKIAEKIHPATYSQNHRDPQVIFILQYGHPYFYLKAHF